MATFVLSLPTWPLLLYLLVGNASKSCLPGNSGAGEPSDTYPALRVARGLGRGAAFFFCVQRDVCFVCEIGRCYRAHLSVNALVAPKV